MLYNVIQSHKSCRHKKVKENKDSQIPISGLKRNLSLYSTTMPNKGLKKVVTFYNYYIMLYNLLYNLLYNVI